MQELIWAETYKMFKQGKTYYALLAIFIIEIIVLFSAYYQGSSIIDILLDNLKQSFYFEGNLLNGNLLVYLILNTLWFHLPLILMIVISGMLTAEYKDNTIQSVMLQPVSKWKFLLSKYLVAIAFTLLTVFFLALSAMLFSYTIFGKGDLIVYLDTLNFFSNEEAFTRILWAFLCGTFSMIFFSVVSLTLAVIFKESTKTWIISALFLIISNMLLKVDFDNEILDRFLFFKLNDTWQYLFYYEIPWQLIYSNCLVLLAYSIISAAIGILTFNKQDVG